MAEGNYLRKRRKSFFLSSDACEIISQLSYKLGLSEGGVIEIRQVFEASDFPPDVLPPQDAAREEAMREELRRTRGKR